MTSGQAGDLRILLLGKTGVGKSTTGNTILGRNAFKEDSKMCERQERVLDGKTITVIDTPGLFNTSITEEQVKAEIERCVEMSAPGPHVFLLVFKLGVRFTQEERNSVQWIQENFGKEALLRTIVLFTHTDLLKGKSLDEYITESHYLPKIVESCGGRYHSFNNEDRNNQQQVTQLLQKIHALRSQHGMRHYTPEMFYKTQSEVTQKDRMKPSNTVLVLSIITLIVVFLGTQHWKNRLQKEEQKLKNDIKKIEKVVEQLKMEIRENEQREKLLKTDIKEKEEEEQKLKNELLLKKQDEEQLKNKLQLKENEMQQKNQLLMNEQEEQLLNADLLKKEEEEKQLKRHLQNEEQEENQLMNKLLMKEKEQELWKLKEEHLKKKQKKRQLKEQLLQKEQENDQVKKDLLKKEEEKHQVKKDLLQKKEEKRQVLKDLLKKEQEKDKLEEELLLKEQEKHQLKKDRQQNEQKNQQLKKDLLHKENEKQQLDKKLQQYNQKVAAGASGGTTEA